MNLLLFEKQEIASDGILSLRDRRARHLIEVLRVRPGDEVRVGELNGGSGLALVRKVGTSCVELEVEPFETPLTGRTDITVILALPRPQSVKKVLQYGTSLGVDRFIFINSARVEQSYFSSPLLRYENLREQLLLGLEQARLTNMPRVSVVDHFKPTERQTANRELEALLEQHSVKLLADPNASETFSAVCRRFSSLRSGVVLALGPEGGWLDWEREYWRARGFSEFHLGERILRVEVALSVLLGQLQAVTEIKRDLEQADTAAGDVTDG